MHQPSRRQFVVAVTAGVPLLLVGKPEASGQSPAYFDPVLDAILADFRELRREGDEKPGQRRGAVRAAETLTGVLAAHLSKQYDPDIKRALRLQLRRKGRQALVQELTAKVNKPEVTHESIDAMLTRLERDGIGGVLREAQNTIKRMRENMPPDYLQVRSATQYDFCADLNWIIQIAEMSAAIACGIAVGLGGLSPAADAACAATMVALGMYYAMRLWYNC